MKYLLYILNILILPALWSCTNDDVPFKQDQQEGEVLLTLTLKSATLTTRTEAGVTDLNENAIHKVDLFLYPTGKTNENAVVQKTDINNFTSQVDGEVTFTVPITSEQKDYLFPAGSNNICVGYAIANRPGDFSAPKKTVDNTAVDDTSMEALKNIVISSTTFEASEDKGTDDQKTIAIKAGRQADFVMDGYTDGTTYKIMLTSNDSQEIVTGTIPLDRAASKITLGLTVTDYVTEDGVTWTPGDAEVLFYHGIKKAKVDVTYNANTAYTPVAEDYFDLTGKNARQLTKSNLNYTQEVPFYSYSSDWGNGDKEAYLVLVLYWTPQVDGGTPTPFYYRVPINPESNNLVRNTYYKIDLEVGILGSRELSTETVELSPSCILLDWGNNNITADLKQPRYLVVDQTEISIYNVADTKITFASSHDVTVTVDSIGYYNYAEPITRRINIDNIHGKKVRKYDQESKTDIYTEFSSNRDDNVYSDYDLIDDTKDNSGNIVKAQEVTIAGNAGTIDFSHTILENTYSPHDIYITIQHTDNAAYVEKVKITQYPPIYIMSAKSNGVVFVNQQTYDNNSSSASSSGGRFTYVENDKNDRIGSVTRSSDINNSGDNTNQNQYNIYITVPPSSEYSIGDPREKDPVKLSNINELNIDNSNYRPTRKNAVNIIAPIFKIASSYGKTTSISYDRAKERCASYQENGYPAGRWRIPTKAEFEFIIQRSYNDDIPSLFDEGYWVADKTYFNGSSFAASDESHAVRCVYDVWYWGDENEGQMANTYVSDYQLNNPVWGDTGSVIEKED